MKIVVVVSNENGLPVKEWFEADTIEVKETTGGILYIQTSNGSCPTKIVAEFNEWTYWREIKE